MTKSNNHETALNLDIVLLMGNFHSQMSFLGSIGYVMKNTAACTIYAENSVKYIRNGKSYKRAMRHFHNIILISIPVMVYLSGTVYLISGQSR